MDLPEPEGMHQPADEAEPENGHVKPGLPVATALRGHPASLHDLMGGYPPGVTVILGQVLPPDPPEVLPGMMEALVGDLPGFQVLVIRAHVPGVP